MHFTKYPKAVEELKSHLDDGEEPSYPATICAQACGLSRNGFIYAAERLGQFPKDVRGVKHWTLTQVKMVKHGAPKGIGL